MKITLKITLLFSLVFLTSCSNNSTDDLIGPTPASVTYNGQIKAVIQANCISCHSDPPQNFAPMRLTTYEDVKNAMLTRGLHDRISRPQGAPGMMPQGGTRLPQATIDLFTQWEEEGLAE